MSLTYAGPDDGRADAGEIRRALEAAGANDAARVCALRSALSYLSSHAGPSPSAASLLMAVIRTVLPNQRHKLVKKLALLFVELVPKTDASGRVLAEVILLCNALRGDLQHANEHVRAFTLRFVARLREAEILEPLVPSVRSALGDTHASVRRAAVIALAAVASCHSVLVPDACDVLAALVAGDVSEAVRSAALYGLLDLERAGVVPEDNAAAPPTALVDAETVLSLTSENGQLAAIEWARRTHGTSLSDGLSRSDGDHHKVTDRVNYNDGEYHPDGSYHKVTDGTYHKVTDKTNYTEGVNYTDGVNHTEGVNHTQKTFHTDKTDYTDVVGNIAENTAFGAVRWAAACALAERGECARALAAFVRVAGAPETPAAARRAALEAALRVAAGASAVPADALASTLAALRALGPQDSAGRAAAAELLALLAADAQGAAAVCVALVRELRTADDAAAAVLGALDAVCARFPAAAPALAAALVDVLCAHGASAKSADTAANAARALRAVVGTVPPALGPALAALRTHALAAASGTALADALWVLGASPRGESARLSFDAIVAAVGALPLAPADGARTTVRTTVRADGTYASVSRDAASSALRAALVRFEAPVVSALASALARLALATGSAESVPRAMRVVSALLRRGLAASTAASDASGTFVSTTAPSATPTAAPTDAPGSLVDRDTYDRLVLVLRVLGERNTCAPAKCGRNTLEKTKGRSAIASALLETHALAAVVASAPVTGTRVDAPVVFRLASAARTTGIAASVADAEDIARALGAQRTDDPLARVVQLTGFADEIYAECRVLVAGADVWLDVLLVSQVATTLADVRVELSASGGLRVPPDARPPPPVALAPGAAVLVKVAARARGTAADGTLHGAITYAAGPSSADSQTIVLAPVRVAAAEFMRPDAPAPPPAAFREKWVALEWENKIAVGPAALADRAGAPRALAAVVAAVGSAAALRCVTPRMGVSASGTFAAANMYARSIFGEDVLANVCLQVEDADDTHVVTGHIRLRAKTHAVAVAIGERITEELRTLSSRPL